MLLRHLDFIDIKAIPLNIRHKKPTLLRNDLRQVKTLGNKAKAEAKAKDEVKAKVVREALKGRVCRKGVQPLTKGRVISH